MKKFLFLTFILVSSLLFGQKNPYNSFERLTGIGFVVSDPSNLTTGETVLYGYLNASGCTISLIDTTYLDNATYDGTNNWDDLNLVIISSLTYGASTASPDTTLTSGIGDVDIICMEPEFWTDFGLPDSSGYVLNDSVAFVDTTLFPNSIWAYHDSVAIFLVSDTLFIVEGTGDSTEGYITSLDLADTLVVLQDFGNSIERIAWGLSPGQFYEDDEKSGSTPLNRLIAYLYGNSTDSIFSVIQCESWTYGTTSPGTDGSIYHKIFLELNGHTVDSCKISDITGHGSSFFRGYDLILTDGESGGFTAASVDTLRASNVPILNLSAYNASQLISSFDYGTGTAVMNDDSSKAVGARHQSLSNYTLDSFYRFSTTDEDERGIDDLASGYFTLLSLNDTLSTAIADLDYKEIFFSFLWSANYTSTTFDLISDFYGWLLGGEPFQTDTVTITALSPDSMTVEWNDLDESAQTQLDREDFSSDTGIWSANAADGTLVATGGKGKYTPYNGLSYFRIKWDASALGMLNGEKYQITITLSSPDFTNDPAIEGVTGFTGDVLDPSQAVSSTPVVFKISGTYDGTTTCYIDFDYAIGDGVKYYEIDDIIIKRFSTYGVRVFSPDTTWWDNTLYSTVTKDTIAGFKPNDEAIIDIFVFGRVYNFSPIGGTTRYWRQMAATSGDNVYATTWSNDDIYMQTNGTGAFSALGQTNRTWFGLAASSSGNVYASVFEGDIYKQTSGTGAFIALNQGTRNWTGMTAAPNGDIYAAVSNSGGGTGDIYVQTGGTGNFVSLGETSRNWRSLCATPSGDIYAVVYGGDIYKQTAGAGSFNALNQTSRNWNGITAVSNDTIYASVFSGDIYIKIEDGGDFEALNQTSRTWGGMTAISNNNVYAAVYNGDIYTKHPTSILPSLFGGDTSYTICTEPTSPFVEGLSDTSVTFTINGFWFYENFKDTTCTAPNTWTAYDGGWEIYSRYWQMMSNSGNGSGVADTNVAATPYVTDGTWSNNLNQDVVYSTQFRFDDSLGVYSNNFFEFYVMADSLNLLPYAAGVYPDGYWVKIEPHYQDIKGFIRFLRYKDGVSAAIETLKVDSSWADPTTANPKSFKWNNLQVVRRYNSTPSDTTVRWSVVLNGDSLFHYNETDTDSMVFTQDGIVMRTNSWHLYLDNVTIRSITPGSNNDSTHYAFQDSISGNYIDWNANPDTLKSATEIWGTYYEWHSLLDTLSQLDPYTTYNLRLKARSGRQ